jgi:hypothetical protein
VPVSTNKVAPTRQTRATTRGTCGVGERIECGSAAVDSVGLFACKELGGEFATRAFLIMNPHRVIMKGFMVATMNPLSWDVVRRFAVSDQRHSHVPADEPRTSLTLMIETINPACRGFSALQISAGCDCRLRPQLGLQAQGTTTNAASRQQGISWG